MTDYICKRCGYKTNQKGNLIRHLESKKSCKVTIENISIEDYLKELKMRDYNDKTYECEFCSKIFNSKSSMYRHKGICKKKKPTLENQVELLQKEIEHLKNMVINNTRVQTNIAHQNNINIGNVNINIKDFSYENKDYLDDDLLLECFRGMDLIRLLEELHFNIDHPENHNIRIKNVKQNLMEVFVNGKWNVDKKEDALTDLMNNGWRIIDTYYKDNKEDIDEDLDETEVEESLQWLYKIYKEDPNLTKEIKEDLFLLVLNNKALLMQKF